MHHVEDDGNGNFTVVMAVRKRSVDDIIYVKLPTGKNAEGKFVFTDYPYWDKSNNSRGYTPQGTKSFLVNRRYA